jgi:putative nucleotidyltransferase with HDIG domain
MGFEQGHKGRQMFRVDACFLPSENQYLWASTAMFQQLLSFLKHQHSPLYKMGLVVLSIFGILWSFPKEAKFSLDYERNKPWMHQDLIAPFDFAIDKSPSEVTQEEARLAFQLKPFYRFDPLVEQQAMKRLPDLLNQRWASSIYARNPASKNRHLKVLQTLVHNLYTKGIIEVDERIEHQDALYTLNILKGRVAQEVELKEVFTIQTAFSYVSKTLAREHNLDRALMNEILETVVVHNISFDAKTTEQVRKNQMETISLSKGMKYKGQRIISRGDMVDQEHFQILESMKSEFLQQSGGTINSFFIFSGQLVLVSICVLMIILFLFHFRPEILYDNAKFSFILLLMVMMGAIAGLSFRINLLSLYLLPYCILPVLVRAFLDTRTALFTHVVTVIMLAQLMPNPYEFAFIQLVGGIFTIFSIVNLRNRSQLFISTLFIFLTYSASYIGLSLIREGKFSHFDVTYLEAFALSAVLTLFAYPLIFVFEKIFGFASDVSLMELGDINSPLLRELALKAPGTFQHSLQVAALAEEAIIKIGGSSLLVRVGALYHDIGKTSMPMYFVENQYTGVNPHNELSFRESANIIIGHVSGGIRIAKEAGLPDAVVDFIRTHHGTTKAEYFYKHYQEEHPDEPVDESGFQYPGPLPFSKETAVLMMADAVEAASRTLNRIDAEAIEQLVNRIIDHQVELNQFVNAPITFRNVNEIKKVFKKRLLNMNHLRIEYPR